MSSCELSGGSALILSLALLRVPSFRQVNFDGNSFSDAAISHLQSILGAAGKMFGVFTADNNDVDENEDDFADVFAEFNNV